MNYPKMNKARLSGKKFIISSLGLLLAALFWPVESAQAAVYSFNLGPPNTATNGSDTIRLTGAGTFDTVLETVDASGSYSISNSDGKVIERGTWHATDFEDFESLGGPNKGVQGGLLEITVTRFPNGGAPVTGQPMTVFCDFDGTVFHEDEDATTIGDFDVPTGGLTVFHLIKP